MNLLIKLIAKTVLNGLALYVATIYFPAFLLTGGVETLIVGGVVLALLNMIVRPVLRLVATPLVWISFGLFNIVIHVLILWIADQMLLQLTIGDFTTLFWASIIVALANIFF